MGISLEITIGPGEVLVLVVGTDSMVERSVTPHADEVEDFAIGTGSRGYSTGHLGVV